MSKVVYILSGLPCTGKTWIRHILQEHNEYSFVYSTDDYIEQRAIELNQQYSDIFMRTIDEATTEMNHRLEIAIGNGCEVIIWDQTNLTWKKRDYIVNKISTLNESTEPYQIVYYSIAIPVYIEEWIRFAMYSRPGKSIPENVLMRMLTDYQIPGIHTTETNVIRFIPCWRQR